MEMRQVMQWNRISLDMLTDATQAVSDSPRSQLCQFSAPKDTVNASALSVWFLATLGEPFDVGMLLFRTIKNVFHGHFVEALELAGQS